MSASKRGVTMNTTKDKWGKIPSTKKWTLAVLVLASLVIAYYNPFVGLLFFAGLSAISIFERQQEIKRQGQLDVQMEELALGLDAITREAVLHMPIPLLAFDEKEKIIWNNPCFEEVISDGNKDLKPYARDLLGISISKFQEEKEQIYEANGRTFDVVAFEPKENASSGRKIGILAFLESTETEILKNELSNKKAYIACIQIDNHQELFEDLPSEVKSILKAEIDTELNGWAKEKESFILQYDPNRYIFVFYHEYLEKIESEKFDVLDRIREIQKGNKIPPTISIGLGISEQDTTLIRQYEMSKTALDIALARGGDQAVVNKQGKVSYYGGKTQAVEKRTKVKARVKAHGIKELIEQSDKVLVMGHRNPDVDSLGAAIGMRRCASIYDKTSYVVLENKNPSIDILYQMLLKEEKDYFITEDEAKKIIGENTLLIVVDVNRPSIVESPEILKMCEKVVVIDHHVRSEEYIEKGILTYIESYASSTSEMVSEIIEYLDEKVPLSTIEATALLAGIYMDTKSFSIKTGVRTFEAASFLKRKGADTALVKEILRDDREVLMEKSKAVENAEIFNENIAIATVEYKGKKGKLIVAQTADELLNIQNIDASFVIAKFQKEVFISGRSFGEINVQRILEEMGGGGHMTMAGAQLEEVSVAEAKEQLLETIKRYLKEGA
ncbi:MAG TPA: hypothetical protein DHN33_02200 [Eubacteriaceae bacterium]|nr:hypothetical protein [Eubacteriaceae bacterium]